MVGILCSQTRLLLAGILLVGISALAGCGGGGSDKTGTVEGKVTIDGTNANSGSVVFTVGGTPYSGQIDDKGDYRAVGVAVGEADVTFLSAPAQTAPKAMTTVKDMPGSGSVAKPIPIPEKYKTPAGAQKFTVKSGTNKKDWALTK